MTDNPHLFADYEPADLTGATLALVRATLEYDLESLELLTRSLEPSLIAGCLLGPLIHLAERMFGSPEEVLAWLLRAHESARGHVAD